VIFHSGHGFWLQFQKFREMKVTKQHERTRIRRRHTVAQKKIDHEIRRADISLNSIKTKITAKEKIILQNIYKSVQAKLVVHEYVEARAQIIEGLTIDRHNENLNILLAQLYEMEGDYAKAEILFRDIILYHDPIKALVYIFL